MKSVFNVFLISSLTVLVCANTQTVQPNAIIGIGKAFQELNNQIREKTILPDSAKVRFQAIMADLRLVTAPMKDTLCRDTVSYVFPVKNYGPKSIGGKGAGYFPRHYKMFDHSAQNSHPAQDIFIRDLDNDSFDDRTCLPVPLLAMRPGVVIATETKWQPDSEYKGGNFIWIYDPCMDGLFYYAHNYSVFVNVGDHVGIGQIIGEVGRTGKNAYASRSQTHLHLMYLQLLPDGLPEPRNTYEWLLGAKLIR